VFVLTEEKTCKKEKKKKRRTKKFHWENSNVKGFFEK
jgi:hypothetical protein